MRITTFFLSVAVGAAALTNQSLWIDEAHSAFKTLQPTLAQWWNAMSMDRGSDLQMPVYMLYLWGWGKLFGTSEIALRAANVPWFAVGVLALVSALSKDRPLRICLAAAALTNAFLWYYMSEARPYIMLFGCSALAAGSLFHLWQQREDLLHSPVVYRAFCIGIIGMCSTNLIAVPWAAGFLLGGLYIIGFGGAVAAVRRFPIMSGVTIFLLILLALYYLWSLRMGARGTEIARTGWSNIAFSFYEMLGIAGLGPGRLALRGDWLHALIKYLPAVSVGAAAALGLCAAGVAQLRSKATSDRILLVCLAVALPAVVVVLAAMATHLRLVGRHFTPMLPYLLILLAFGLRRTIFSGRAMDRVAGAVALTVLFSSALQIRFAERHNRDDYRSAAAETRTALAQGRVVWWAADVNAASYYQVPLDSPNLILSSNLSDESLHAVAEPDLVCLSKPDIYDPSGRIAHYLQQHHFKEIRQLWAFEIFERPRRLAR